MQRKRDGLVAIGEALADLPGPVQALIAIWRGDAAPPFERPAPRAAAGAAGGRGAPPPEPPCRCADG